MRRWRIRLRPARRNRRLPKDVEQVALTVLVLSMLLAPFIIQYSESASSCAFVASEWLLRSMQLTKIAAQSMGTEKHVILCGFGRNGQYLARFLARKTSTTLPSTSIRIASARLRPAAKASSTAMSDARKR
jgi:hypothetical protein